MPRVRFLLPLPSFLLLCHFVFPFAFICSSLAQLVEHAAVNRRVVGSSPTGGAIFLFAAMAQVAEHILGKDEVTGSNPVSSSIFLEMYPSG